VKIILSVVAVIIGLVFAVHAVPYMAGPSGRCMLGQQPNILLGSQPDGPARMRPIDALSAGPGRAAPAVL
jgi:hypothetical protein